jgi:hypothetical protein
MKSTQWERCSEVSIESEMANLREVEANIDECLEIMPVSNLTRYKLVLALSFVQQAIEALTVFQSERATSP